MNPNQKTGTGPERKEDTMHNTHIFYLIPIMFFALAAVLGRSELNK